MDRKKKSIQPERAAVEVLHPEPEQGLTTAEAEVRARAGWVNGTPDTAAASEKEIILKNCATFFNLVFLVLAVLLVIAGSSPKNMTFLVVVVCNTVIGCFQEIRSKRAVDQLTLVAAQTMKTIRDGAAVMIRSDLLVRDDIVEFSPGNQICADAVVRSGELQVNESLVTGEADPIVKRCGDKLRSGSFVVAGIGRAQLTKVGPDSYAARLAAEAKANPKAAKSEMMRSLDKLIKCVGLALVPIGILLFHQEYTVLKLSLQDSMESVVAALVGMIPEGLYLLTSVAMAASALKLTKQRVLVQDMNCIETLARVDVLCVDKTGTITEPKMEVENVVPLTGQPPERLEAILDAFYHGQTPENDTARAMGELFGRESDWICTRRIPFTSATKWSGAVFQDQGAFLVGAPEFILGSRYGELKETVEDWSSRGYRVLLAAQYEGDPRPGGLIEERLIPLALIMLTNRIRPEAPATFAYFAEQGVSIRVISGDNPATVAEVARRAGIRGAEHYVDVSALESDEDLRRAARECVVFGRVTPDKKKKLIRAMKAQGHTVAMTGDGVNDVLALKEADCGIAMASGSQAASQISSLVLLNSDFKSMPSIVNEGRKVINNIQRSASLFLVKNIFSFLFAIIAGLAKFPYPLQPLQLSLISSLTIGYPAFFLSLEPNNDRFHGHFLPNVLFRAAPGGITDVLMMLGIELFARAFELPNAQLYTISCLVMLTVGNLMIYQGAKPLNKYRRLVVIVFALASVIAVTIIPHTFLKDWVQIVSLTGQSWLVLIVFMLLAYPTILALTWLMEQGRKLYENAKAGKAQRADAKA